MADQFHPERITTVKFLRKQAKDAGDLGTVKGRALHKAAAHFIRLGEELRRCEKARDGDIDATAEGIRLVAEEELVAMRPDYQVVPWERLDDEQKKRWVRMARVAHGMPAGIEIPEDE